MQRTTILATLLLLTACAGHPERAYILAPKPPAAKAKVQGGESLSREETELDTPREEPAARRAKGDFVVQRFTLEKRLPVTMTQRVVSREGNMIVLDVSIAEGKQIDEFRLRVRELGSDVEVVSAARLIGGAEKPASVDEYEHSLARTTYTADENRGAIKTSSSKMDVAGEAFECEESSYEVRVGRTEAIMRTVSSKMFPWGDISGEVRTANGRLLYRAELLEAGFGSKSRVAQDEDY